MSEQAMSNNELSAVSRSIRKHLVIGILASAVLAGGVGAWAATVRLSGAVVASGSFVVDSHIKKVQHLTGGVVGAILVRNGDRVEAGDVVMRLDATQTRSRLAIVIKRLDQFNARLARLEAERDDRLQIVFPESLTARASNPDVAAAIRSEKRLFEFRRKSREGRKAQLRERIRQFRHEIEGLKAQEAAYDRGILVLEREIASLRGLLEKGLVNIQRLNALETQATTFGGERGEKIAFQAQTAGRISETELQIIAVDDDFKTEIGHELREIQGQIGEFTEHRIAAEDELKRVDIVAPQDGVVHSLAVHTIGGVVSPGDVIMYIVPASDGLELELQVQPQDIDQITTGQEAVLRLSAFNRQTTPELNGYVSHIAADLTSDQRTGMSWYVARVAIRPEDLARLGGLTLVPGMPAEALIKTGDRTALSYVVKPLADHINRSFREE